MNQSEETIARLRDLESAIVKLRDVYGLMHGTAQDKEKGCRDMISALKEVQEEEYSGMFFPASFLWRQVTVRPLNIDGDALIAEVEWDEDGGKRAVKTDVLLNGSLRRETTRSIISRLEATAQTLTDRLKREAALQEMESAAAEDIMKGLEDEI